MKIRSFNKMEMVDYINSIMKEYGENVTIYQNQHNYAQKPENGLSDQTAFTIKEYLQYISYSNKMEWE
jgi:hypothetical protein